ncbi:unnamed protein product [Cercopithifilaria johnstoni]|uniref:Uncharacterized protein n=1 Tax=Cercopithifilaria johnstoni TaxID=2874296 RepID=A0A8J2Q418_9BILA|nr:unnamed protein product [Cercopithifilaria johnstoni]
MFWFHYNRFRYFHLYRQPSLRQSSTPSVRYSQYVILAILSSAQDFWWHLFECNANGKPQKSRIPRPIPTARTLLNYCANITYTHSHALRQTQQANIVSHGRVVLQCSFNLGCSGVAHGRHIRCD